ncbi:MAG: hypothetical protein Q8P18_29195 [Pseudomonadota bacterium]|nr:hypothetical protein [Pseudomonadota bacterium]
MTPAVQARLRNGGADRLADLLLDDLLDRPLSELVDARWMADRLVISLRSAAADPRVESWFRERVQDVRARVQAGPPQVPLAIRVPLSELLARPYAPNRALVGKLLDHPTAQLLLKSLFQDLLIAFARRLKPITPKGSLPSFGRLSRLGEGVLGAMGHEIEQQIEQKAREFMDQAVHKLVDKMADHLCDPAHIREYGAWRTHGLDVLLGTDMRVLAGEVEKLDPESLIATGAALVRGIAGRAELAGEIEAVLDAAMESAGTKSAREMLGGVEEHGLELVRDLLRQRARAVIETDAFARWFEEVVEGTGEAS